MSLRFYPFTYTGNATDNTDISGCPFSPTLAWVHPADATTNGGAMSWVGMGSDQSFDPSGATSFQSNMIQAWNSDGIEIGSSDNVNKSGTDYYGVMMAGDSSCYYEGSYSGDGTTSKSITGVGFNPDLIFIKRAGGSAGRFYSKQSDQFSAWSASNGAAGFLTTTSDGFDITSASSIINGAGYTYHFVAIKFETGFSSSGSFTGNATDNRAITGVGYQPDLVIMKANSGAQAPIFRTSAHSGDDTTVWITTTANIADAVQSLDSDGFTVGTNATANRSATTMTWMAFKDNPPVTATGDFFLLFD